MLLGEKESIPPTAMRDFRDCGVAHLLAVSGLHVSILVGFLQLLLKRCSIRLRFFAICMILALYCALTCFAASTLRASVMTVCLLLGKTIGRRNDSLSVLSLAAILLTAVQPFFLFTAGFQLSFTAVLGILLLNRTLSGRFSRLPDVLRSSFCMSGSAQTGTLPITLAHFNQVPLIGIVSNLLIVPLAPLVVVPTLIALPLYAVLPTLGRTVAGIADMTLLFMQSAANLNAKMPLLNLPSPPAGACVLFLLGMLFFSHYCLLEKRHKYRLGSLCFVLCVLLTLFAPAAF